MNLERLRRGDLRIEDRGPAAYLLSSFVHYGLRALFLPAVQRDQGFVTSEYNHDHRDEYWKDSLTVDEFIFGNSQVVSWVLIEDRLCRSTEHRVRARLLPKLLARVATSSGPGDLVVEFGAGTGRNLAYLARELPDREYLGLELTPRSVTDARAQLARFGLRVEMRVCDMTRPVGLDRRAAVSYSVLALEQLPNQLSRAALEQMSLSAENAVVCYEPIRELYPLSVRGITSRLRQYRADYLAGLPRHARDLGLHIREERRTGLAHNPLNEICELVVSEAKNP